MAENYEDIVKKWYVKLRHNFIDKLMTKYKDSKMREEDAEDIYQEVFMVIRDNLMLGRIKENTSWSNYVMTIGLNMASKHYRTIGKSDSYDSARDTDDATAKSTAQKVKEIIKSLASEDRSLYTDPEAQEILGEELIHTPEPCASLIRLHYYAKLKDAEIVEEMQQYTTANSIKVVRNRCMRDLTYRVKLALYHIGIIDVKPQKSR